MILPPGADVIEVHHNQSFVMATPIENPNPEFPATKFEPADTITICSRFIVTAEGDVRGIEQIDDFPDCEPINGERSEVFMAAVQKALDQWTFFGAAVCEFAVSEDECTEGRAVLNPIAIRLAYRFTFSAKHGRRQVFTTRND